MSTPCEPRPCALHVLVDDGDTARPDPVGLLAALGDRVTELTVHAVHDRDGEVPLVTLLRAADVIDDLTRRTGRAVRYEEQRGDIVTALRHDVDRGIQPVVALPAGSRRRALRAVRRAADRIDAHVAVVPNAPPSPTDRCEAPR